MAAPLILVSNPIKDHQLYQREQENDLAPRLDYMEITRKLGGELIGYRQAEGAWNRKVSLFERRLKLDLSVAFQAFGRASQHSVILSASEKSAIPLSMILAFFRRTRPHILIGHHLSSKNKTLLFRIWRLQRALDQIIVVSRAQAAYAVRELGFPEGKVTFLYDKVDHHFFRPSAGEAGDYILAVGQEQRDYNTLVKAVAGTGIRLVIVASSPWSTFSVEVDRPEEVEVRSHIPFRELRDLYTHARLVVVPLFDADYAAGANAALEAMAMARPLVLTRTAGICDYVAEGETGIYTPPGNPAALREILLSLWEHPATLKRLGTNARQIVEERMNLDLYTDRVTEIVQRSAA